MNIDPRIMQQFIKLQISDNLFTDGQSAAPNDGDNSFFQLFASLLEQTNTSTANAAKDSGYGLPLPALTTYQAPADLSQYDELINRAATAFAIDGSLIKAVIHAESSFRFDAVSRAGAKGLMQLMDDTAAGLGVENSYDPVQNVFGGTKFLRGLLDKYNGNVATALAAYNAGPGRIDRLGIANDAQLYDQYAQLPRETQNYVRKVLNLEQIYRTSSAEPEAGR